MNKNFKQLIFTMLVGILILGFNTLNVLAGGVGGGGGAAAPEFRRGDVDHSGTIQLTDAIRVLEFSFLGKEAPDCLDAADADNNGTIQLTDAVRILGYLFLGGPAPENADRCAADTGDSSLGCNLNYREIVGYS